MDDHNIDEALLNSVISHLDGETKQGSVRMSVNYDENQKESEKVSRVCCNMYGRSAQETVNLLDMYTDSHIEETMDRKP